MIEVNEGSSMPTTSATQTTLKSGQQQGRMTMFRQQVCNWAAKDKHTPLRHFEMEVTSIFLTKNYDITETEEFLIII